MHGYTAYGIFLSEVQCHGQPLRPKDTWEMRVLRMHLGWKVPDRSGKVMSEEDTEGIRIRGQGRLEEREGRGGRAKDTGE